MESTQAISAPGMPGATVIETSLQPQAPAAAPSSYRVGPADLTGSKAAAARYAESVAAEVAKGTSNMTVLKQYREAMQHSVGDGAAPSWLKQTEDAAAALTDLGAKTINGSDMPGLAAEFEPMAELHVDRLINRAVITTSLPREIATEAAEFCLAAQLPQVVSEALMDRLGKHAQDGFGIDAEPLTEADVQTLSFECSRMLGGDQRAAAEIDLARKYLYSVGGDTLLATVDQRSGSLGYDPRLILQLSMMARARGLDK